MEPDYCSEIDKERTAFKKNNYDIADELYAKIIDYLACEELDNILHFFTYKECFLLSEDGWIDYLMR